MYDDLISYEKLNKDFLDTLPLRKPNKFEDVRDYRDWIEYEFKDVKLPEELQGCILNYLDDYEFGEYLGKRFNMKVFEEIRLYLG